MRDPAVVLPQQIPHQRRPQVAVHHVGRGRQPDVAEKRRFVRCLGRDGRPQPRQQMGLAAPRRAVNQDRPSPALRADVRERGEQQVEDVPGDLGDVDDGPGPRVGHDPVVERIARAGHRRAPRSRGADRKVRDACVRCAVRSVAGGGRGMLGGRRRSRPLAAEIEAAGRPRGDGTLSSVRGTRPDVGTGTARFGAERAPGREAWNVDHDPRLENLQIGSQ